MKYTDIYIYMYIYIYMNIWIIFDGYAKRPGECDRSTLILQCYCKVVHPRIDLSWFIKCY